MQFMGPADWKVSCQRKPLIGYSQTIGEISNTGQKHLLMIQRPGFESQTDLRVCRGVIPLVVGRISAEPVESEVALDRDGPDFGPLLRG